MIQKENVIQFVTDYKEKFEAINPSFFEWTTALAFSYFAEEKTDIAIIETGLGGKLDSTNIIHPVLSVITGISYDHTDLLGETLPLIAAEKAGIIKTSVPVVIGASDIEVNDVFLAKANEMKSEIFFADQLYTVRSAWLDGPYQMFNIENPLKHRFNLLTDLPGYYQRKNILTVLASLNILSRAGWQIENEAMHFALANVKKLTGFRGRWEVLKKDPIVIADVAHNEDGLKQVSRQLSEAGYEKLRIVIGFVSGKNAGKLLSLFPSGAKFYFCKPDIPRGMDVTEIIKAASDFNLDYSAFKTVHEAYEAALQEAQKKDVVFIGGSSFVVAEILSSEKGI